MSCICQIDPVFIPRSLCPTLKVVKKYKMPSNCPKILKGSSKLTSHAKFLQLDIQAYCTILLKPNLIVAGAYFFYCKSVLPQNKNTVILNQTHWFPYTSMSYVRRYVSVERFAMICPGYPLIETHFVLYCNQRLLNDLNKIFFLWRN